MSTSSGATWGLLAVSLMVVPIAGYAQDKSQFRDEAKAAEARLRALGEPKDRCSIGAYVAGDGVITRVFVATGLMPGDQLLTVNGVNTEAMRAEQIIGLLRDIDPSAMIPITVDREGEFLDIQVACANARPATEALLNSLGLASRGKFDECVTAVSQRNDLGADGAALKVQCASLSRNASRYNLAELTLDAMRMMIEDAHWLPDARPEVVTRLRAVEGMITQRLGAARFQDLVAATRAWPGGERMFDAAAPDWALFRRSSEAALRARLIDPESARIEWPYGFLYGSWKPFLARQVDGYWTCGSVNARNRMGGYTGSASFVVVLDPNGVVQYLDIGESDDFDIVGSQCANSVRLLPAAPPELSAPMAAQQTSSGSIADELAKLVDLRDSGALSESEFQAAKERLLGTAK